MNPAFGMRRELITRRTMLGAAATLAATPALAEECRFGPTPHQKGRPVFLDYDQAELDAAYENSVYEPNIGQIVRRLASQSDAVDCPTSPTWRPRNRSAIPTDPMAAPRWR